MGLALHGGLGLLTRAYGLTSDNLINATIVTANGSVVSRSQSTVTSENLDWNIG